MGGYNESVLHTFGRALASGQWRSRAVEAFQNAQRIALARKGQEQDEAYRQKTFQADQDYRTTVQGPVALRNAESRSVDAGARDLGARTRATALLDEIGGGQLGREVIKSQASKVPAGAAPGLVGAYDPNAPQGGVTSPAALDAFKAAQAAQHRQTVQTAAGKAEVQQKAQGRKEAYIDTFRRLNERTIGPQKRVGLPDDEAARRARERVKGQIINKVAAGDIDEERAAELLRMYDEGLFDAPAE